MTLSDIAKKLFGAKRAETTSKTSDVSTLQGTVVSDSENGHVEVAFDADCTTLDGTNVVSIGTLASLKEGDQAIVMLEGGGVKRPTAIGAAGWGDRIQASIVETNLLIADKADIEDLEAANAHIGNLEADNLTINNRLEVAETSIGTLEADNATINGKLTAAEADIDTLQANSLTADSATIKALEADTAKVHDLSAEQLSATVGYIGDLTASNVTAQNIVADHGDFDTVKANAAKVQNLTAQQLEADHATVGSLDANYAKVDLLNVNNAWIDNGVINKAAIMDEQVFDLSGNKATISEINADKITVRNLHTKNLTVDTADGYVTIGSKKTPTKEYIDSLKDEIQDKIDATVETYTSGSVPLLNNYPASSWADDDTRLKHVGDICFVTNSAAAEDGYCYRFAYDSTTQDFSWVLIKDNDVTKALKDITDLQEFESDTTSWISETDQGLVTIRQNHTALSGVVDKTVKSSTQLWYTKADTTAPGKPTSQVTSTSTAGNAWRVVVPAWNASYPNYYYCWQYLLADGTYAWSSVVRDIAMGESQGTSRSAQTTANANIKSSVQLWFTKANSTAPSKPTSQVTTNNAATGNAWNLAVPTYNASYPHYFYCYQQQKGDGTYQWSDVVYDKGTTEAMQKAQAALPSSTFTTFQSTTFKNLVDEVDEQSSTINQMSEKITTTARNLLTATLSPQNGGVRTVRGTGEEFRNESKWYTYHAESTLTRTDAGIRIDHAGGASGGITIPLIADGILADGEKLTLSFDYRGNYTALGTLYVLCNPTPNSSQGTPVTLDDSGEWAHYEYSWTYKANANVPWAILIEYYNSAGKWLEIRDGSMILERGAMTVTTLTNTVNSVKQTATANTASINGINTIVSNNGLTSSTNITSRASKIEQTLDGFSSTVGAIVDETVTGTNILTGNALNPYNWTISAPSGASYTKTAYGTAGVKVQFSTVSGYERLYSPAITVVSGKKYTLSVEYTVGKDYTIASGKGGFGLSVYKAAPTDTFDSSNANFVARAQFFETATRVAMKATVTFTASSNTVYLGLNGGQINDSQSGLMFTLDKLTLVENISSRMSTAETSINQTADAIGLTATGTATIANPNLTPFFESHNSDGTYPNGGVGGYWQTSSDKAYNRSVFTALGEGWAHIEAAGTAQKEFVPPRVDSLKAGDEVTMLVEWRNATYTGTGCNFYTRNYANNVQLSTNWYPGNGMTTASGEDRKVFTVNSTATGAEAWNGLVNFTFPAKTSSTWTGDVRVSFYLGDYKGPWKPYSGSQLYASQSELRVTADGITSVVSKIPGAKYLTSSVNGWALSSIKGYAVEGTETTFNVLSSQDVRVGDTVYIKGTDNTRTCPVYIKGTVVSIPASTQVRIAAHGYEDALPINTAISSINQSAESVKIKATKIEIDGTTTFTGGGTLSSYVQGKVDEVEVGGRNLLLETGIAKASPAFTLNSSNYAVYDYYTLYKPYNKIVKDGDLVTISFDWSTTSTGGNFHVECGTSTPYTWGTVVNAVGTRSATSNYIDVTSSNKAGHAVMTFQAGSAHVSAADTLNKLRIRADGTDWSGKTITLSNVKAERGNKATDWSPAPEDQTAYADELLDGLVIGGRNLATGTGAHLSFTQTSTPTYFTPTGFYKTSDVGLELLADTANKSFIVSFDWAATDVTTAYQLYPSLQNSETTYTSGGIASRASIPTGSSSGHYSAVFEPNSGHRQYGSKWLLSRTTNTANTSGTVVLSNFMFEVATKESAWSLAPEDVVTKTQRIYQRRTASGAPTAPATWLETSGTGYANWATRIPQLTSGSTKYPYLYTCTQTKKGTDAVENSPVVLDDSTTVIDGGSIITNSITANKLATGSITVSYLGSDEQKLLGTTITTATDFNTLTTTGTYYIRVSSNTNAPTTGHGKLEVNFNVGTPYQIWQPDATNTAYYKRQYKSSAWSAWTTIDGKAAYDLANTANNKANAWRGTESADMAAAAKTVSCAGFTTSHLVQGVAVTAYCQNSQGNTGTITLNVNSTGAYDVWVGGAVTSDTNRLLWLYGCTITFVFVGTTSNGYWKVVDNPPAYYGATCTVAEGTAAKTTVIDNAILYKGTTISVPMSNSNTASGMTLAVLNASNTSLGNFAVYHGTSTNVPTKSNGLAWPAGEVVIFTYDGKFWRTGNQTFINGGNIITGTVAADRIAVSSINIGDLNGGSTVVSNASDALNKVNYYNRRAQAKQSTTLNSSKPWYKFAAVTITTQNTDRVIKFDVVSDMYGTTKYGTLIAHVRAGANIGTVEYKDFVWLDRNSAIDPKKFVLAYKLTSGTSLACELWCKLDELGWHGFIFNQVYESGTVSNPHWTLYTTVTQGSQASITSGYTQQTSTDASNAFITVDSSGIKIAKASDTSNYLYQTSDGTKIYKGGSEVASFGADKIELGKNSKTATIEMCKGSAVIEAVEAPISPKDTTKSAMSLSGEVMGINSDLYTWLSTGSPAANKYALTIGLENDGDAHGIVMNVTKYGANTSTISQRCLTSISANSFSIDTSFLAASTADKGKIYSGFDNDKLGIAPVALYSNESAAFAGSIKLAETAANFTRLEIYCKDNDGRYCYTQVWNPNGKTVNVTQTLSYGGNFYVKSRAFGITNQIIDTVNTSGTYHSGEVNAAGSNNANATDVIKIVKVLGYR